MSREQSAQRETEEQGQQEQDHQSHHEEMVEDFKRRFWVSLILSVPVLLLSPLIQAFLGIEGLIRIPGESWIQFGFATLIFFYGGWPFLKGLADELGDRQPGMMTLIALAIAVAYFYSSAVVFGLSGSVFFWELSTLIVIMLLGHWIEMRSVMGASSALEELVKLMPAEAHRLKEDGSTEDVPVTDLEVEDVVLVKPGEKIPVDGVIVQGRTTINESMLTGESKPVEKGEEDDVIGGGINGEASIRVRVEKTGDETYLSQVIDMVREAQESRSKTQNLADRAALWLTVVALSAGFLTLTAWLLLGQDFNFALSRMVTVMVITCPHALGLAIPLVVAVSTAMSARHGLLIRNRASFELARGLDAIIFDKTGTLTEGRFGVTDVIPLGKLGREEVLQKAASLESESEHPIAAGIVERAREKEMELAQVDDFSAIPGKGAEGRLGRESVKVVSPGYLEENGLEAESEELAELRASGKTIVFLIVEDQVEGALALADVVREESQKAINILKEMGIQIMMVTGDSEAVARQVAEDLGLDDYFAEVLPDKKAEKVREVKQRGLRTAMVGDGVNDAPALVEADVGIAIGAGTDVAIESAGIVLVESDPRDVTAVVDLARATYRKMVQNLWWATGYNVVAIPLAAGVLYAYGVLLSPAVGAVLMSLSTVIVAINARLLGKHELAASS